MAEAAKKEDLTEEDYNKTVFNEGGGLVIDLTDIAERKSILVPKGWYDAEIDEWEFGNSQSSGAPMFTGTFRLTADEYSKIKLKKYFSFSKKALAGTKADLCKLNKELFGGKFNPEEVAGSGQMLGMLVKVKIGHSEYEGEQRANITAVIPQTADGASDGKDGKGKAFFG